MTTIKPFGISKRMVLDAYRHVKANRGAEGIDEVSLKMFDADLSRNLYQLWNRMASGSYFPPPVMQVEIPKKQGGVRLLGVPTVSDRIAQAVVKARIESELEPLFHPDSYGYRPNKSAVDAVAITRERCWKFKWLVEFDIRRAFDELDWDLMLKAVRKHVKDRWALLYIERWLKAPFVTQEGVVLPRSKGTPQGGVISCVLMNLFMHYAFDRWMQKEHGYCPFARYADDAVVHCRSEAQAKFMLAAIEQRLKVCKLEMHPAKSGVVYCKSRGRNQDYSRIQFTFLGFTFRPRSATNRAGQLYTSFRPAVSQGAIKEMLGKMRSWELHRKTSASLHELAERYNPVLRGWLNYYGSFYKSAMSRVLDHFDQRLVRWARRKYRKLERHQMRGYDWLARTMGRQPRLFDHWLIFKSHVVRTMGAV